MEAVVVTALSICTLFLGVYLWKARSHRVNFQYFVGKTILVTGAATGLGKEIVQELVTGLNKTEYEKDKPTKLILIDIKDQYIEHKKSASVEIISKVCDLSKSKDITALLEELKKEPIHILINNAGIKQDKKILDMSAEEFQLTFQVNVFAHFQLIKFLLQISEQLQIVGIHSVMSHLPSSYLSDYCSSKAASFMLYDVLRQEVDQSKIQVLSVCPYVINTDMFKAAFTITNESSKLERIRNFLFPPLKKEIVARMILRSTCRQDSYLYVYSSLGYIPFIMRLLPTKLFDFFIKLGCGEQSMRKIIPDQN